MIESNWSKESRQSRGYGAAWDRTRKRILARDDGLCQCEHCRRDGRTTLATEVDHVVSRARAAALGWMADRVEADANLQAINHECHKRKTQDEMGKGFVPKVCIGLDGFPLREKAR